MTSFKLNIAVVCCLVLGAVEDAALPVAAAESLLQPAPAPDSIVPAAQSPSPRGRGKGPGHRRGAELRKDQQDFHFLLEHHAEIRRSVTTLENGVETLTESDNPEVAEKIQQHVVAMHARIKNGRGLRFWDDLFVALFEKHADIQMTVETTEKGVKVIETSADASVVPLIQAHAAVVSLFVERGFDEARRKHRVPVSGETP